jgi:RES domain-containing protein
MATAAQRVRLPRDLTHDDIPVVDLKGRWYRQTAQRFDALSLPHRAMSSGRCHCKGQQPRLYASSTEAAAWGEIIRHLQPEVSPMEVIRAMSSIEVTNLPVVDFTDPLVREMFSVSESTLTSNDYAPCRKIADMLRQRPDLFGGLILPSAAIPGERTLVVFQEWIPGCLQVVARSTKTAPARLLRLFETIVDTLTRDLQRDARRALRRTRREIEAAARNELDRIRRNKKP